MRIASTLPPRLEQIAMSLSETLKLLKADLLRYAVTDRKTPLPLLLFESVYRHPSAAGVIYYRFGQCFYQNRRNPLCFLFFFLHVLFYPLIRLYSGVELSPRAQIGPGLCVMHFGPTVIHPDVVAGKNLTLLHRVTLGYAKSGIPQIGDNVSIGVGATVIGGILIGDNVSIGAGAVVTKDIPANCTAVGIPARSIGQKPVTKEPTQPLDLEHLLGMESILWEIEV